MNLFNVYSLYDIEPVRGNGAYVYDENGREILDFYGGHAVMSIGHSHPHYIKMVSEQLGKLGFTVTASRTLCSWNWRIN